MLSQKDTAGIATTATRSYTAGGMVFTRTDGSDNTMTTVTDIVGRTLSVTDAAGNVTSLRTFRAGTEIISSDPSTRTDGDVTTWSFHPAIGLELSKTYADNSTTTKTYDAYNSLATETDARGNVKTHTYEHARGLLLCTAYSVVDGTDATVTHSFSYNHLGLMTQVVDDGLAKKNWA